jgi:hypothetical protein
MRDVLFEIFGRKIKNQFSLDNTSVVDDDRGFAELNI